MTIDQLRQLLEEKIPQHESWLNKLNEAEPGHYGVDDDWHVQVAKQDISVNIPSRSFTFRNAQFTFELTMGESFDGTKQKFSKSTRGKGIFEFVGNDKIKIIDLLPEIELDLFAA